MSEPTPDSPVALILHHRGNNVGVTTILRFSSCSTLRIGFAVTCEHNNRTALQCEIIMLRVWALKPLCRAHPFEGAPIKVDDRTSRPSHPWCEVIMYAVRQYKGFCKAPPTRTPSEFGSDKRPAKTLVSHEFLSNSCPSDDVNHHRSQRMLRGNNVGHWTI